MFIRGPFRTRGEPSFQAAGAEKVVQIRGCSSSVWPRYRRRIFDRAQDSQSLKQHLFLGLVDYRTNEGLELALEMLVSIKPLQAFEARRRHSSCTLSFVLWPSRLWKKWWLRTSGGPHLLISLLVETVSLSRLGASESATEAGFRIGEVAQCINSQSCAIGIDHAVTAKLAWVHVLRVCEDLRTGEDSKTTKPCHLIQMTNLDTHWRNLHLCSARPGTRKRSFFRNNDLIVLRVMSVPSIIDNDAREPPYLAKLV